MTKIQFNHDFDPLHGQTASISENITRITARNESAFTYRGTNSYLVGQEQLALIDPGPMDNDHLDLILKTIGTRELTHIFITHTHKDHSPLTDKLVQATGAQTYAEGIHRPARTLSTNEVNPLQESNDTGFVPDHELADGQTISGGNWRIQAIHTPGHTKNHCAFAFLEEKTLFSGDHIMAWSTSIIAPPDGSMKDYMKSLDKIIDREDTRILPGHGPEVLQPHKFVADLKNHRLARKNAIYGAISKGLATTIPALVKHVYTDLDPKLHSAAALSVLAHLEELVEEAAIITDGPAMLDGNYTTS